MLSLFDVVIVVVVVACTSFVCLILIGLIVFFCCFFHANHYEQLGYKQPPIFSCSTFDIDLLALLSFCAGFCACVYYYIICVLFCGIEFHPLDRPIRSGFAIFYNLKLFPLLDWMISLRRRKIKNPIDRLNHTRTLASSTSFRASSIHSFYIVLFLCFFFRSKVIKLVSMFFGKFPADKFVRMFLCVFEFFGVW